MYLWIQTPSVAASADFILPQVVQDGDIIHFQFSKLEIVADLRESADRRFRCFKQEIGVAWLLKYRRLKLEPG